MSGTVPPIPPPLGTNTGNAASPNRVDTIPSDNINNTTTNNVAQNVVNEDLPQFLDSRGGSHVTNVPEFDKGNFPVRSIGLRLKFNAFKALKGEKVNGTFTRLKCLLNDLENNGVSISQAEVNATFVNSLPRKWLSMNQTQRANNSIKNDTLASLYGKYNYKEGLIDQIYETETSRSTIQASSSKSLISNTHFQDSNLDVEEDTRSSSEFLADLNAEFHDRALLANKKRFYKQSERVGSAKKPMDKSNETCFACGKLGHFQKDCPSNKTSIPSYPSSTKIYNKPKFHSTLTSQNNQNVDNHQKDYKWKYKGLKAEIANLTKNINSISKGKSEKGLVVESFDWNEESVSSEDEEVTKVKAFMAIAEDELSVGKVDAGSGQWVKIAMKKVHKLLSMIDGEERKHVLDYTHVDLHYVEDQSNNLLNEFNFLNQELSSYKLNLEKESLKDEITDLKKVIEKWTSSKVTLDQLLTKQVLSNIVCALCRRGKRKETISSKEVVFTKADESPTRLPLRLPLTLTVSKEIKKVLDKKSVVKAPKKKAQTLSPYVPDPIPIKKADSSTEKLLLTLMEEVKGLKVQIQTPLDKNYLPEDCYMKPKCSTCGSTEHLTKEHPKQAVVKKIMAKLKAQSSQGSSSRKALIISKPFIDCKYCGFNDHHSDECEYYPGCDIYGSIAHETVDCTKKPFSNKSKPRIANRRSTKPTKKKMENLNEVRVKELRSDNGTEFKNHKLVEFYDEKGISQNFSSLCTPNQNGRAERRNRTLIEAA
ncbi:retrovirus-related pol polyprotein from transposon TNT 1-94 [Tanacetum coccineum]